MRLRRIGLLAMVLVAVQVAGSSVRGDRCPCPITTGENPYKDKKPEEGKPRPGEISEDKDKDGGKKPEELASGEEIGALGGSVVAEDEQQAVIAWNGSEEIMILTTNEKLLLKKGSAILHFMPLPGKVSDIYRADKDAFKKAKKLVRDKLALTGVGGLGVFMEKTIGAHNIFVWKLEDPKEFPRRVQAYVMKRFGGNSKAYITKKMFEVVNDYYKRGFRYFAFDLVLLSPEKVTTQAIGYRFESPKSAFYPLVISSAGAKGDTLADLVIFSKGELKPLKNIIGGKVKRLGNRSVAVTHAELAGVDRKMAALFNRDEAIRGRIILISGKLEDFKTDFEAQ